MSSFVTHFLTRRRASLPWVFLWLLVMEIPTMAFIWTVKDLPFRGLLGYRLLRIVVASGWILYLATREI